MKSKELRIRFDASIESEYVQVIARDAIEALEREEKSHAETAARLKGSRLHATHAEMADGCLEMIRETMERLSGESADAIPPMFYNDWIAATAAKGVPPGMLAEHKAQEEALERLRARARAVVEAIEQTPAKDLDPEWRHSGGWWERLWAARDALAAELEGE